jgi:GTPase SAR1 family protein
LNFSLNISGDGMNLLPASHPKTFNLLSIGQRGVGKTVFLAGSYAELHPDNQSDNPQQLWFDCQDSEVQANIEKIKNHVSRTGLYPPPTIKITNFNFSLKRQSLWGVKTVCNFRWWDIPGESCNISNPDFQEMVLSSNGCCVFLNASALVRDKDYPKVLEDIYNQVMAIASLVNQYDLKYAFALILTKSDLLELNPVTLLQIEQNLQPLISRLEAVKAKYQKFYSAIPIVYLDGTANLKARGAAAPLLWLLSELNKHHNLDSRQDLASGLNQSLFVGQLLPPAYRKSVLFLSLVSISLLGIITSLFFAFGLSTLAPEKVPVTEQLNRSTPQTDVVK